MRLLHAQISAKNRSQVIDQLSTPGLKLAWSKCLENLLIPGLLSDEVVWSDDGDCGCKVYIYESGILCLRSNDRSCLKEQSEPCASWEWVLS